MEPNVNFAAPTGQLTFLGYANQELATKKLKFCLGFPDGEDVGIIGSKSYTLSAAQVRQLALTAPV